MLFIASQSLVAQRFMAICAIQIAAVVVQREIGKRIPCDPPLVCHAIPARRIFVDIRCGDSRNSLFLNFPKIHIADLR
ncbi:hypothetical protein [Caballeronia sp. GACF4]|jgi:hypothetical protein|uniref:hypothetical protein n=1 Tax=Caballeronia sp. GACF4 TaxID=2921763 RepID=UPI002027A892|nr:hypothetical protein [Caballeronia sp. GACF4]